MIILPILLPHLYISVSKVGAMSFLNFGVEGLMGFVGKKLTGGLARCDDKKKSRKSPIIESLQLSECFQLDSCLATSRAYQTIFLSVSN